MSEIAIGAATTSAIKIVRRDHSISLKDRSKIRKLDATKLGGCGVGSAIGGAKGGADTGWFVI
jgi:hypothetical protein